MADNDAWGYYRYSVAKQGSIILASESQRMAIPKAKFICVSSADPEWYEFLHKTGRQAEIKRMLMRGLTYELNALANKDF